MKHVLVPMDFSETAHAALQRALRLADWTVVRITLLHVTFSDAPSESPVGFDAIENLSKTMDLAFDPSRCVPGHNLAAISLAAEKKLDEIIRTLNRPQVAIATAVRGGRPAAEIIRFANQNGVDLIVMGTHGRGPVARMFLGSVTESVIRAADCPVLSVRK